MNYTADKEILSRWSNLITDAACAVVTPVLHHTTQAQGTRYYEITTDKTRYFLKQSPLPQRRKIERAHTAAFFAETLDVHTITPKQSSAGNLTEQLNESIYELYDWYAGALRQCLPENSNHGQTAEAIGRQIALMHTIPNQSIPSHLAAHRPLFTDDFLKNLAEKTAGLSVYDPVYKAVSFIEQELLPYLPYMERCFSHGDLHPDNILLTQNGTPYLSDWELCGIAYDLFDCAFLTGCIGMDDPSNLSGSWIRQLLTTVADTADLTPLSCATFHALIIGTRLLWFDRWLLEKDEEMLSLETAFLDILLKEQGALVKIWNSLLKPKKNQNTKWVIQDAVFDSEIKQLKERIITGKIRTADTLQQVCPQTPEECAEKISSLIIAFGKDNDVIRIIDMICIQEELSAINKEYEWLVSELAFTYANASLDFSRHHQMQALETLIAKMNVLLEKSRPPELPIALSYVLRNWSIALSELNYHEASFSVIETLRALSEKNRDCISIREELARALSSGVITALQTHDLKRRELFFQELTQLRTQYPDSVKINGAYKFAEKNLKLPPSRPSPANGGR